MNNESEQEKTSILKSYFKEIIVGIIFLIAYYPIFVWMWGRYFATNSYYSHGVLVPFVSIFLIWNIRDEIIQIKKESSSWGMPIIFLGLFIYMVSTPTRVYFTAGFSMLIVLMGLILHFFGMRIFRKILFPIFFLL